MIFIIMIKKAIGFSFRWLIFCNKKAPTREHKVNEVRSKLQK